MLIDKFLSFTCMSISIRFWDLDLPLKAARAHNIFSIEAPYSLQNSSPLKNRKRLMAAVFYWNMGAWKRRIVCTTRHDPLKHINEYKLHATKREKKNMSRDKLVSIDGFERKCRDRRLKEDNKQSIKLSLSAAHQIFCHQTQLPPISIRFIDVCYSGG